jgi:hypothetical protein
VVAGQKVFFSIQGDKHLLRSTATFDENGVIPFVIPSEAGGSAVLRTRRGKTAGGRMTILLEF